MFSAASAQKQHPAECRVTVEQHESLQVSMYVKSGLRAGRGVRRSMSLSSRRRCA